MILCGSGYKDGSEIRESVLTLLALDQQGAKFECFAPDDFQTDVVNCFTSEVMAGEKRHMLVESARIARGEVKSLMDLHGMNFDGLIMPGGFGAAKNLCDFAFKGATGRARPDVAETLREFHQAKKPIGAVCIAPAVLALTFKNQGFKLTVGAASETSQELEKLGHTHVVCPPDQCVVDKNAKIVTSPAYMYEAGPLSAIATGISSLVREVLALAKS